MQELAYATRLEALRMHKQQSEQKPSLSTAA
jgi:hypothetical protein